MEFNYYIGERWWWKRTNLILNSTQVEVGVELGKEKIQATLPMVITRGL